MRKLVVESLEELFEAKTAESKTKPVDVKKVHSKIEQTKPEKVAQDKKTKIKEAIAALELQKKKAQKPGGMKQTLIQKKGDIAEIQTKIDAWKKKLTDLK